MHNCLALSFKSNYFLWIFLSITNIYLNKNTYHHFLNIMNKEKKLILQMFDKKSDALGKIQFVQRNKAGLGYSNFLFLRG